MENKAYTLYCNNVCNEYLYHFTQTLKNITPYIKFDIIEINNIKGEASRGIPSVGISLFCHFITNKKIKYRTSATKIYDNGLGYGINLLNIDLENYSEQFNHIDKNKIIEEINDIIFNSIKFCETYINANF